MTSRRQILKLTLTRAIWQEPPATPEAAARLERELIEELDCFIDHECRLARASLRQALLGTNAISLQDQIGAVRREISILRTHFFASAEGLQEHIDELITVIRTLEALELLENNHA